MKSRGTPVYPPEWRELEALLISSLGSRIRTLQLGVHELQLQESWQFLVKLNRRLLCDPVIPLPGIYPGEITAHVHTKTSAALLIIAQNCTQPEEPVTNIPVTNYKVFIQWNIS